MKTVAFFDTKPYDIESFKRYSSENIKMRFFENKLNSDTVSIAACCDAVCAFVNDNINSQVIDALESYGVGAIAMRCAGYNNVDLKSAEGRIKVFRVPAYSPYSVAEHTIGMILLLNRKLHKAYIRTRDHNFSLDGLMGFDLNGKTVGIIGTGKIGCCFANIAKGFGMEILGYDPCEKQEFCGKYTDIEELLSKSDIITLHCPLTKENRHIISKESIEKMKDGVFIINTSRGQLIDTQSLADGLKSGKIGAAGLDVYEEEASLFFEDMSDQIILDDLLASLIAMPNVLVTSHQAFFTRDALDGIAKTTIENLEKFFNGEKCENEVVV